MDILWGMDTRISLGNQINQAKFVLSLHYRPLFILRKPTCSSTDSTKDTLVKGRHPIIHPRVLYPSMYIKRALLLSYKDCQSLYPRNCAFELEI